LTSVALPPAAVEPRREVAPPTWLRRLVRDKKAVVGLVLLAVIVIAAIAAPILTPYNPSRSDTLPRLHPSLRHPFGTTDQGMDVFAQVVYGARLSLVEGAGAALVAMTIATAFGLLAAVKGGILDEVIGLVTSLFLVLPRLPLLILAAILAPTKSTLFIIALVAFVNWAVELRVLRSQALGLSGRDFILAARTSGESPFGVVFRELLPNMLSRIAAGFLFVFVQAVFTAAALDFLGFGDINKVSWGTSLYWAYNDAALFSGEWWVFFFPGMAIAVTALALTLVNYGIDELSNPRLAPVRRRSRRRWRRA
jgi:peptide/nickel transport system permease protein